MKLRDLIDSVEVLNKLSASNEIPMEHAKSLAKTIRLCEGALNTFSDKQKVLADKFNKDVAKFMDEVVDFDPVKIDLNRFESCKLSSKDISIIWWLID